MKKTKLIFGLASISALGTFAIPLTSCSNEQIKVQSIEITGKNYVLVNEANSYNVKVLPENATKKDVKWSVEKVTGSTAEAEFKDGKLTFTKPGEINLVATAEDGSGVLTATKVVGLSESYAKLLSKIYFCTDDWSEVCQYANAGFEALNAHYSGLNPEDFIGLERVITLNGVEHIVRVIGTEHDTISGGTKKAALTFELVTLLSDSAGTKMASNYDAANSCDYTKSTLRANLTGQGGADVSWVGSEFKKSVIEIIENEDADLFANIKTVDKEVATNSSKESGAENWQITKYQDKLFPLSCVEIDKQSEPEASSEEGSIYGYYNLYSKASDRVKEDAAGNKQYYWLVSPYTTDITKAWHVDEEGARSVTLAKPAEQDARAVSFAFCI